MRLGRGADLRVREGGRPPSQDQTVEEGEEADQARLHSDGMCSSEVERHQDLENRQNIIDDELKLVGTLFIDITDIYCFGWSLPLSTCKHIFQYRHFV